MYTVLKRVENTYCTKSFSLYIDMRWEDLYNVNPYLPLLIPHRKSLYIS